LPDLPPENGKGDELAAKSLPAMLTDHTDGSVVNELSDKFLFDLILNGENSVGKSAFMPGGGTN
jgi:hypothetical protein